jgi:hypothetical protein
MRATANGVLLAGLAAATAPASAQEAVQASQTTPATDAAQTAPLEPARGNIPRTLRCESPKGRERSCPAETRGGVRVSRQLSRSPCVEGQTWGVRPGEIWVKAGCRADFGLGGIDTVVPGPLYFKCESTGLGRQHCPVSTRGWRAAGAAVVQERLHPAQHVGLRSQQRVGARRDAAPEFQAVKAWRRRAGCRAARGALRIRSRARAALRRGRVERRGTDQAAVQVAVHPEPQLGLGTSAACG